MNQASAARPKKYARSPRLKLAKPCVTIIAARGEQADGGLLHGFVFDAGAGGHGQESPAIAEILFITAATRSECRSS